MLANKADPRLYHISYGTGLQAAAESSEDNFAIIDMIINNLKDVNAKDVKDKSLMDYAREYNNEKLINHLNTYRPIKQMKNKL
jgi:hypothetical protein